MNLVSPLYTLIWSSTYPTNDLLKKSPKITRPGHITIQQMALEIQAKWKVLPLEVDKGETKFIEKIIEVAKEKKYFEEMWDKQVHVSKVVVKDTSSVEIKRLINVYQKNTNFHSSMTAE